MMDELKPRPFCEGIFYIREDNCMSLSCAAEIEVKNGKVKSIRTKGMPRANGKDFWFLVCKKIKSGTEITNELANRILSFADESNNVLSYWSEREKEQEG